MTPKQYKSLSVFIQVRIFVPGLDLETDNGLMTDGGMYLVKERHIRKLIGGFLENNINIIIKKKKKLFDVYTTALVQNVRDS